VTRFCDMVSSFADLSPPCYHEYNGPA
jgi:hypothetical protein